MLNTSTLADITLRAQQRADMVSGAFISSTEWTSMVNASASQLWDKLVEAYGSDFEVASSYSITTDGTNDAYTLPTDFYRLLGVDLQITGSSYITLWKFNFADRNRYTLPNIQTLWGRTNVKYRLRGGSIWFIPLPAASTVLRLWYAPRFTPLSASSDVFDGINGWEEWIVNDVAIKAKVKEESPIDDILKLQASQEERLSHVMENRDAGAPPTTVDVYGMNGGGYGGNGEDWGL